jgi:hypothetical protein
MRTVLLVWMQCVSCEVGPEASNLYLDELHAWYIDVQMCDETEFDLHEI